MLGHPYPEVTDAICLVPSTLFTLRLSMLYLSTSVGLGYGLYAKAISWKFLIAL